MRAQRKENGMSTIIAEALKEIEKQRAFVESYAEAAPYFEGLAASYPGLVNAVRLSWGAGAIQGLLVILHPEKLSDVAPVLRHIRQAGWEPDGQPEDDTDIRSRDYRYKRDALRLTVRAIFRDSVLRDGWKTDAEPAACRFVQTGTKTVPVYELVCVEAPEGS
jgi:hypothetical protein